MTPESWYFFGSFAKSGAADDEAVSLSLVPEPELVWSPQAVSSSAPATARAPTAAIRDLAVDVRRVVRAVMIGVLRQVRGVASWVGTLLRVSRPCVFSASCHSD